MNMISQLRQRIVRTGTATITTEEFNQLQAEWITRTKMEKDELTASPVERLVSTFYFDRHNPLGGCKMAEGAKVTAVDEREALTKARELFGQEWIFKLRQKETC